MHRFRVARPGATAAVAVAALATGAVFLAPRIAEHPHLTDQVEVGAALPEAANLASPKAEAPETAPGSEAAAEQGVAAPRGEPDTLTALTRGSPASTLYQEAVTATDEAADGPIEDTLLAEQAQQAPGGAEAPQSAGSTTDAAPTDAVAMAEPAADTAVGAIPLPPPVPLELVRTEESLADRKEGEKAAADEAIEQAAAAEGAVPLPPTPPTQLADAVEELAEEEETAEPALQVAVLKDAPLPPARPRGEELPWISRPVIDRDTARATAAVLTDLLSGRFDQALAAQERLEDPLARTLIEFLYVRDGATRASWRRIRDFMREHPGWPSRGVLERRLEVAMFSQKASTDEILETFADTPPETNLGRLGLAQALLAEGRKKEATERAAELWRRTDLTAGETRLVEERLGSLLTKADHRARAVRLVYVDELSAASSLAARLDDPDKKLIQSVVKALQLGGKKAEAELKALPKSARAQPLAVFAKARLARRAGKEEEAARILIRAAPDDNARAEPEEWWLEKKLASRWLLERGRAKEAYELSSKFNPDAPVERSDAEWQAGWIALRFLDDADAAVRHFTEAREVVSLPISVSRAEYWLGRAHEARGDEAQARQHYEAAGEHFSTYYGQLALHRLGREKIEQAHKPVFAHAALRWASTQEPVKAIRLLMQLGQESLAAELMVQLARDTDNPTIQVALGELAHMHGLHTTTLTIGKLGTYKGAPTEFYSFTTEGLPAYPVIGTPVDPALVYAIARQESVFNSKAMSHAGARGLMQLMPATARMTAKSHGQAYHESRLLQDPTYNVMIGAAHLGELMDKYGYYAFVFAAYNAGGGRIPEWIERFGDPRTGEVDPVDWVELIPYAETRNYVQRVMEGLEVYRGRLGDGTLRIAEDLRLRATALADSSAFETAAQDPVEAGLGQ